MYPHNENNDELELKFFTRLTLNTKGHLPPVSANRAQLISSNSKWACRKETLWLFNEKSPHPDI